jgi:nucleoside 2-deoxyribosyltransferase
MPAPGSKTNRAAKRRVYLAGPDVFLQHAQRIAARKKRLCAKHGFEGVFPLDAQIKRKRQPSPGALARAIAEANEALIRGCDIVVANCSPFRGVSMDAGTAYEIGYARALGKPVFGYTNVVASYRDRADRYRRLDDPLHADMAGSLIEDFGLAASGHDLVRTRVKRGRELSDLAGFARCMALAGRANSPTAGRKRQKCPQATSARGRSVRKPA